MRCAIPGLGRANPVGHGQQRPRLLAAYCRRERAHDRTESLDFQGAPLRFADRRKSLVRAGGAPQVSANSDTTPTVTHTLFFVLLDDSISNMKLV